MICKYCGTKSDGNFCPNCGAELVAKNETTIIDNNTATEERKVNTLPNTSGYYPPTQTVQQQKKKNTPLGIVALILSFFGPLAFIGLILGVVDIAKDKQKEFKHGLSIAAIVISCLMLLYFFAGLGDSNDKSDMTTTKAETILTEEDTTKDTVVTTEIASNDSSKVKVTGCDLEKAKRAAIVAITNGTVYDVLDANGEKIDTSKLHSYSDISGDYLIVNDWGTWTAKNENTWHAEGLVVEIAKASMEIEAKADVSFDGKNYIVSNLDGEYGLGWNLSDLELPDNSPELYLIVSPKLVEKDRDEEKATHSPDNSALLDEDIAMGAFDMYADYMFPYGIKIHWVTGTISHAQDKTTGEWFFKVNATVTNGFGAKYDTIIEGRVSGTNDSPQVTYFNAY